MRVENRNVPPEAEEQPESEAPKLKDTGERFLPGATAARAEMAYDHIARYRFAERYVKGKKTVDLGCGVGFGTHSLSRLAESVLGVDLSEEAVAYASWFYEAPNLRYKVGDVTDLPYDEDGSFEAAVSFEVIEHLKRPDALVKEARRLLSENGIFVASTPDKQTYSNDRNYVNPHHPSEMYTLEFREILERYFEHVQMYRQGALAGNIITHDREELPEDGRLTLESTKFSLPDPAAFGRETPTTFYMIAVCTNGPAPDPLRSPYAIVDRDRQIYEEHTDLNLRFDQLLAYHVHERERWQQLQGQAQERAESFERALTRAHEQAKDFQERLQEQHEWAVLLQKRLQEQREQAEHSHERAERLQKRVGQLQLRVEDMQNSRAWRITQRLNGFGAVVRRILGRG